VALVVLLGAVALGRAWVRPGSTAPITDRDGRPVPGSVAALVKVKLGGALLAQRSVVARYGGEVHGNPRGAMLLLLRAMLRTREYGWRDRVNVFRGAFAGMRLLWPQILSIDLFAQAPELKVPVWLLLGRHDREAPSAVAERYLEALAAPRKTLVWFERSAHFPDVEEPDELHRVLIERVLGETATARPSTGSGRAGLHVSSSSARG